MAEIANEVEQGLDSACLVSCFLIKGKGSFVGFEEIDEMKPFNIAYFLSLLVNQLECFKYLSQYLPISDYTIIPQRGTP